MAIAKADSLKSVTLKEYFQTIKATHLSVVAKSIHFKRDEEYLGYILRSQKNQESEVSMDSPVLLDGKHGKDWVGSTPSLNWTEGFK